MFKAGPVKTSSTQFMWPFSFVFCEVTEESKQGLNLYFSLGKKEKRVGTEGEGLTFGCLLCACCVPVLSALNALFHLNFSCSCYPYLTHEKICSKAPTFLSVK